MGERTFRVELLHAEALPLHLLAPLSGALEGADHLVRNSTEAHRRHLAEHLAFIRGIDYLKKERELQAWNEQLDWSNFREWRKADLDEATFVASQVENYSEAYGLLNDSFFSLVALGFFASGVAREDILAFLHGQSWATKHEILTRWGWMGEQRRLLEKGAKLPAPYSCVVAHRRDEGRTTDREFYILLLFLHWLRFETGQELLFLSKQQTPDFALEDERGERIGVEVTETSTSNEWDSEQDAEREVIRALVSHLESHFVTPRIVRPASWQALRDRIPELEAWLFSEAAKIDPALERPIQLLNSDLDLKIKLIPSEAQLGGYIIGGRPGGMQPLERASGTLRDRLRGKIYKQDGSPKKLPSVRPCHLVIYPSYDLGIDVDEVVKDFLRHPSIDVSSHFDYVWMAGEKYLARLI